MEGSGCGLIQGIL